MTPQPYLHIERLFMYTAWLAVCIMLPSIRLMGQETPAAVAEKIYLQLDNKVYTKDQTIWMKAIVTDAAFHLPSQLSKVLYVELIGPGESIIDAKILKLENGIGSGHFDLRQQYNEGSYMIRAYTRWNENFGPEFFYHTYVQILSTSTESPPNPISQLSLLKGENRNQLLKVQFDPLLIDKAHTGKLPVIMIMEDVSDSLLIKPKQEAVYELIYEIPDSVNFVRLSLETENLHTYAKTFVLDDTYLGVQFFPESGYLVHGLTSKVGVKALGASGKGVYVAGEILTQEGKLVMPFSTNELGMGYFTLPKADSSLTYMARLNSPVEKVILLPKVSQKGNVLSVTKVGQNIRVRATSNYLKKDSVIFKVACRGEGYFEVKGQFREGQLIFSLPQNSLPEGVIALSMTDIAYNPLAERLFFNERPESRLNIDILSAKDSYLQREKSELEIHVKDPDNLPVPANISVHVINQDQLGSLTDTRDHILSYFLLSSDLIGTIQQPGFYFQKGINRYQDLDAL
ncbi:MAG: hypothetical protein AAGC85_13650, partial [Bacteroidota bacterium]